MGENLFLFMFHQPSGNTYALEEGSWKFGNGLLVREDFVPHKTLDEYAFSQVKIRICINNIPMGMMTKEMGERLGDVVGETLRVDVGKYGRAFGRILKVKVRLQIDKPLMRGVILQKENDDDEQVEGDEVGNMPHRQ